MNVLNTLLSYVLLYRYPVIGVADFLGALLLPIPVNAMLLAVGAFSSQGYFNFWIALSVAVAANTLGDCSGYAITRRYGESVTRALQLHKFKFYDQLQQELRADAGVTVFMTRFASSMSTVANFLAGLVKVPFPTFLLNDFLGNFIEPFCIMGIGYLAGSYWSNFSGIIELVGSIVAVAVVIFVLARIYKRMMKRYDNQ